ncbi:SMI1/KNR4 family protein [Colwellia sp. E2M01]|uniref:SMI1/KNR4 family protein n=1 Tax=Colwellia sp. E2M01 TaxID=2841561 RepID=UPI001C099B93|nr:SMI1/KNR4 family protein [Colwellia sp. E2M01]MBU2870581.1 SMI1/KNR4 family protein [Colwellia sp. E2M01]
MKRIDNFVQQWQSKQTMVPIVTEQVTELEHKLSVHLPVSYKYLISTYGLVHTPNVLTKTCDLNVAITQVQDFLSLDDVFSLTNLYEMSGMPKGHILFASDCEGNMFCFKREDCHQQQDIPVYFYNHDLRTIEQVADSFIGWLEQFNH